MIRLVVAAALALLATSAFAQNPDGKYSDSPTSQWFEGLSSPQTYRCCSQADCRRAASDFREDGWYAKSNRTDTWVKITDRQIVQDTYSIFAEAILCEGDPSVSFAPDGTAGPEEPRVYCFVRPPIGF